MKIKQKCPRHPTLKPLILFENEIETILACSNLDCEWALVINK